MKKFLFVIILFVAFIILFVLINTKNIILFINWGILLPYPKNVDVIYNYDFMEGEDLEIWYYESKKHNNITKQLEKMNKKLVKAKIELYYNYLNETNKELFNKNVSIDKLLSENNYYLFLNKKERFLLIIYDINGKKLYYFNSNT